MSDPQAQPPADPYMVKPGTGPAAETGDSAPDDAGHRGPGPHGAGHLGPGHQGAGHPPDADPGRKARDKQPPAGPEAERRARWIVAIAAASVALSVGVPPVGLGLGIAVVVAAARSAAVPLRRLNVTTKGLSLTGGIVAIVIGGLLTLVSAVLGSEISQLRECQAGANTRVAEQRCQDEFMDSLERRFGVG